MSPALFSRSMQGSTGFSANQRSKYLNHSYGISWLYVLMICFGEKQGNAAASSNSALLLQYCRISTAVVFSMWLLSSAQPVVYCDGQETKKKSCALCRWLEVSIQCFLICWNLFFFPFNAVQMSKNCCLNPEAVHRGTENVTSLIMMCFQWMTVLKIVFIWTCIKQNILFFLTKRHLFCWELFLPLQKLLRELLKAKLFNLKIHFLLCSTIE